MVENEFKIMLTEQQYNAIREMYCWDCEAEQVNTYFDSPDLQLSERHITCRVRSVNGRFLLQMKLPAADTGNGAISRIELERELDGIPQHISAEELTELSGAESLPEVQLLGTLTTFRSAKHFVGAEIDLDKSEYFGKTDYELEIEYTDETAARALLDEISARADIGGIAPITGKIRRFLAEYLRNIVSP